MKYLHSIKCDTCDEVTKPDVPINGPQATAFVREYQATHPCQKLMWINEFEGPDE